MKAVVRQFATEKVHTRFVTRRAMQMLYADGEGAATGQMANLNMQLNSFAILPKEEREVLDLYAAPPKTKKTKRAPKIGVRRGGRIHLPKMVVEVEISKIDSLIDNLV